MERPRNSFSLAAVAVLVAAMVLSILGLFPVANKITMGSAVPWYAHALKEWIVIGGGLLLMLLLLSRFLPKVVDGITQTVSGAIMRVPISVFLGVVAPLAFLAAAFIASYAFGRQPHNADEVAQLFHAKILTAGRLYLPPDPNPEFFGMDNMIEQGRWYSQFPIGGPALLALGLLVGGAWLVNPLLLALTVVAVYAFARVAFGEAVARASALLLALTPFALFMSASFMNHMPVAFLAAVAMAQLARWSIATDDNRAHRHAAFIGLALGVAFTIRPLDAMVVAGVIGVMQLVLLRTLPAPRRWSLVLQVIAGSIPVAALLYVNWMTNGAPTRLGYDVLYGSAHSLGFHVDPYGTMHTPLRAVMFASKYLLQLDLLLFEWPLPAVGVIVAGLVAMRRPTRWDLMLIALLLAQTLAYALYWHEGTFRGPRFLFTALPAIVILAARAPFLVAELSTGAARRTALLALPACVLFAWLVPGMSDSVQGRLRMYRKAPAVLRVDPDSIARSEGLANALVFINEGRTARNLHDLWQLGLTRGNAARLMVSASACAVRVSIDAERAVKPSQTRGRQDRLIRRALAFDAEPPSMPAVCAEDILRDNGGTASYGPFFPANDIQPDGRLGGNVVYALDLGDHNEVLRARFGDRAWYRFGPGKSRTDTMASIIPYAPARK